MIRSMTGFASVSREQPAQRISVTVKSVNHRFLDIALKSSSVLAPIENRLRALVQKRLTRGRVEIAVAVELDETPEREVVVDEALLERLSAALDGARARGLVAGSFTASDVLRVPQLVEIRARELAGEAQQARDAALGDLAEQVLGEALDALVVMRETEGRFLAQDLTARVGTIAEIVRVLEVQSREGQAGLDARLRERLAELPAELQGDPATQAQEIVRFVARSDVDEEIVRLRAHVEHWQALAASPEPCGRKLDFLVQEMNREINTVGSKIEGPRVSEQVIAAKAELERIREQVQNVE
ncbi:MAG TPA: YicC/YloC family endoribonuclease [Vicinamibacterales bacterium]|nr:YicC/YloC family endoribonuclease [Vicinamibacterales bacterium]